MLQTNFSREGMNRYMIVSFEKELPAGYHNSLFQHHSVPYFLQYEVREVDGKQAVYYRLKYHTAVRSVIGHLPFTLERLKNIAGSVIGALEAADEYLLDADGIVWQADKIFLDAETGKLQFCYCVAEGEKQGTLKEFLSEIIQAVGRGDEEAVLFLLQFYNLVTEPDCTLERLQKFRKDYLEGEIQVREKKEEVKKDSISFHAPLPEQDDLSQNSGKRDEKPSIWERIVIMMLIADAVIILALIAGLFFHVFTYDHIQFLFISMGGLIVLTVIYMQMTKEESADTIMQDFFENQKTAFGDNLAKRDKEIQIPTGDSKEPGNDFSERPSKTEIYGETGILTGDKPEEGQDEIVLEEKEGEMYLKPMEKDKYPSIHIDNSIVLGCMAECCNYVLQERGISRMHAKLMKKPDGIYLLDLNSTNGTYLNGELIESGKDYKLEEGDMVAFALSEFYAAFE